MNQASIGVDVNDFRLPPKEALKRASDAAFRSVELAATSGEVAPHNLSASGRRHLLRYVNGLGLHLAALTADLQGLRLTDPKTVSERVSRTCQIIELAADLQVPVVSAALGAITHPETGQPSELAMEALREIGAFADSRGMIYAVRPAHENADRLARVFQALACPSLGVGLDAAALVMAGSNPVPIIARFADQLPLVHMRDGTAGAPDQTGHETRLGEGDVDLLSVLAALDAADYAGAYIIRRTDSSSPATDLAYGREVLAGMLPAR